MNSMWVKRAMRVAAAAWLLGAACAEARVMGIAVVKSNGRVYSWFADGKYTQGSLADFDAFSRAYAFTLPLGYQTDEIVGMAMSADNHVHTWYNDGRVSEGTVADLDFYSAPTGYTTPPGSNAGSLTGLAFTADGRVVAWYQNGTYSIGTRTALDFHAAPKPYTLPAGKTPDDVVELALSRGDVALAWYRDGTYSSGTLANLASGVTRGAYLHSHVLYRWWGPANNAGTVDVGGTLPGPGDEDRPSLPRLPNPPVGEPVDGDIVSPPFALRFPTPLGGGSKDPMVAAGHSFLAISDTGAVAFTDRAGTLLTDWAGNGMLYSASTFFGGFLAASNADGSFNWENLNNQMGYAQACDSTAFPLTQGDDAGTVRRFCLRQVYDTRVHYDPESERFFVVSHVRNMLWQSKDPAYCLRYRDETGTDVFTNSFCGLERRHMVFAVSHSSDPRDGFHQFALTESIYRDFPWLAVNGSRVLLSHARSEDPASPVATVFHLPALTAGSPHPPFFRYFSADVGSSSSVIAARHYGSPGFTLLIGTGTGLRLFAVPAGGDPWIAPVPAAATLPLGTVPARGTAVYRDGKLTMSGALIVESNASTDRHSVRVLRVPVTYAGGVLSASNSAAAGYLDWYFGKNALEDAAGDKVSYQQPQVAVNAAGDMLFGYGRYPFATAQPLFPEARYSVWYAGEAKQRRSALLQAGSAASATPPQSALDYATAVIDPLDDRSFWMALPYAVTGGGYRTIIGRVTP